MISLNDYLYSGDTVLKILHNYSGDLKKYAISADNAIDLLHSEFLDQIIDLLEHNDFLTYQSNRIKDFYKYMAKEYPFLAFTFKGRIKSLVRAEEKFNGYIVEYIYNYYSEHGEFPSLEMLKNKLSCFRDLIAYRIVLSMPRCHLNSEEEREETELKYLYEVANALPDFLESRGFTPEISASEGSLHSPLLKEELRPYFRDYISNIKDDVYRSLHITFYDHSAKCYIELQLRTKEMDDYAEIGPANHLGYEKLQESTRAKRDMIPEGACVYFDDAYERGMKLQTLDLSKVNVNMFTAYSNVLINDGCGFYRGRQILPFEHLSRFQNDLID